MSGSSQADSEEFSLIEPETMAAEETMTAITEPAGRRDETFYWADNVTFSVEDVLFRVSRYPFLLGSDYFVQKYGLLSADNDESSTGRVIQLESLTAAQFKVFLKFLFPIHLTSTTSTYSKEEWLTILSISTGWHFHEARKLAIEHLASHLTDLELIRIGREAYVPRWVAQGYASLIERPVDGTISEDEGEVIGHKEVNRLWAIRYRRAACGLPHDLVESELQTVFSEEFARLATRESQHRTRAAIEEVRQAEEAREAALREIEELELERLRIEEEEEQQRIDDEEAQREWFEEEEQRIRSEEEALSAMQAEELRVGGRIVAWKWQSHNHGQPPTRSALTKGRALGADVDIRTGRLTGAVAARHKERPTVATVAGRIVGFTHEGRESATAAQVEGTRRRNALWAAREMEMGIERHSKGTAE